jgi:hypothetical protein
MIRRLLCAIRGHAGIDNNGHCKKCRAEVDCLPRKWKKAATERSVRAVRDLLRRTGGTNG